jgi:hypothetical protein
MIGTAGGGPINEPKTVTSYRELVEIFGPEDPTLTLHKDAKAAFLNGVFQVVATRIGGAASTPSSATLKGFKRNSDVAKLIAKSGGEDANSVKVAVMRGAAENTVRLEIGSETFDNLTMDPTSEWFLPKIINENSRLVSVESLIAEPTADNNPRPQETTLSGGTFAPPSLKDYERALESLELEANIDVVSVCDSWDPQIHALVDAHCQNMSLGKEPQTLAPRIGIGTVAPNEPVDQIIKRSETLASDRFILVAPYGCAGAVAGLVSKLDYYQSPTFKALTGIASIEHRYTPSEQMKLLTNGTLVIDAVRGRGIIVIKGITTSKEQISVQRIADHATRGTKSICDLYIGTLNNARGRMALRERLTEFLIGMEREGAIVPTTDGQQPAYLVDVYSSQIDFAQGIVRVDEAVRPVRAMDYIYATITVQM